MNKRRVLFLCTGNSCRSQMAEGLVNHYLGDEWQGYSAGTAPTGFVHPMAVTAMLEVGVDISGYRSKSVDEFRDTEFDVIVTVCGGAAENCPIWLGPEKTVHIGFPDPADQEQLAVFKEVRDDMGKRILSYLTENF